MSRKRSDARESEKALKKVRRQNTMEYYMGNETATNPVNLMKVSPT